MSSAVFIAVILAAFLHAVWNAMVKKEKDKYLSITAVVLGILEYIGNQAIDFSDFWYQGSLMVPRD